MKKMTLALYLLMLTFACGEKQQTSSEGGEYVSTLSAGGESEAELKKKLDEFERQDAARQLEILNKSTSLEFDKLKHDFGDVGPDSDNLCKFTVTNTGDKPLIIESVSASCGCTTPKKPEKPILPGKSDIIEVGFHPKPQQVDEIIKKVTVIANTVPKESVIEIRAFVKKK